MTTFSMNNDTHDLPTQTPMSADTYTVDWISERPNTRVRLSDARNPPYRIMQPVADLLSIAILSYVADECIARRDADDRWSRHIALQLPTQYSDPWSEWNHSVEQVLRFVSGDEYTIEINNAADSMHYEFDAPEISNCDCVCLFSGGLDSLSGVIQLLDEGRRVCLVSHYADSLTRAVHDGLRTRLQEIYPDQIDYRPCFIRRKRTNPAHSYQLPGKVENSHRVRSFLFLSLAACFAEVYGVNDIFIPENGVIGLNIALDSSRTGTLSTRTTHPAFVSAMAGIISGFLGRQIHLVNPFMAKSKIEILRELDATNHVLLPDTHSCAKYDMIRWTRRTDIRHCGYCLPCVYRRLSMSPIGLDSADDYYVDIFNELPSLSPNKARDLRCLATFVRRYRASTSVKRLSFIFSNGPLSLPHIGAAPHGATPDEMVAMYDRYANDTYRLLNELCPPAVLRQLGL